MAHTTPPQPTHIPGTLRGEEMSITKGREPGRGKGPFYRTERDSTSVNPEGRKPIHPKMPNIPPA